MKNSILLLLLLFACTAFGQDDKKEKIESLKIGFITTELELSPEEATQFWPLYKAFEEKQFELKNKKMKAYKARTNGELLEKMTEKEAASLLAQMEATDDELYKIRKNFIGKLKLVLPSKKIIKLKKSEDDFKKKLLQQYRDKGSK